MAEVIDIRSVRAYAPDLRELARGKFAGYRRATGMDPAQFAAALTQETGSPITGAMVVTWETRVVPGYDVVLAAEIIADGHVTPADGLPVLRHAGMHLIADYDQLQAELADVITHAERVLAITGSRSRDPDYLGRIERQVASRPDLVYYRVLYGPPRHGATKNHLRHLTSLGRSNVHLGIVGDLFRDQERFIVASESQAVIVLPSLSSIANFDTALLVDDAELAGQWVAHVRQAYLGAEPIETRADVEALEVVR
jgi:hypothetical protein